MIVWIDGTFGAGKTAIANELGKRYSKSEVIDFDEFVKNVKSENPIELFFGKRYPEDKRCYIDALIVELERKLKQDDNRLFIISISLITDYSKDHLVEYFKSKTETVHIILCPSKEKLLERIMSQDGRDCDLAVTYYEEATLYLRNHYIEAIRIDTDNMTIEDVASCVSKHIKDRG